MLQCDVTSLKNYWNSLCVEFSLKIGSKKLSLICNVKEKTLTNPKSGEVIHGKDIHNTILGKDKLLVTWKRNDTEKQEEIRFDSPVDKQRFEEILRVLTEDDESLKNLSETMSIFCTTWNVGDSPPPETLLDLLRNPEKDSKVGKHNIYVIAVQECSHKPPNGGKTSTHMKTIIQNSLGEEYMLLKKTSLWTIRIFVYIRKEDYRKISSLEKCKEACGIAHVIGNKGAVAICLNFNRTSFCFVGSHLAAHQEKVEDRNHDFEEILRGLDMGENHFGIDTQFSHVFWMGDLNYRIDLPRDDVIRLIEGEKWDELNAADQLNVQRNGGKAFESWYEGDITFRPTYRFTRGTNEYNDELGRIPAWCDRILYRSLPTDSNCMKQNIYSSVDSIQTSDHHPVFSTFTIDTLLQNVPHPKRNIIIKITELRGENMVAKDMSGKSDPFVHFFGSFLESKGKTKIKKQTLNPVWKDDEVPELIPFITNEYLSRCYLHFLVQDYDFGKKNDNMGQGVIPLEQVYQSKVPVPFNIRITLEGTSVGFLHGKIAIIEK